MSHFIANSISFNADFTYAKVKGGDNNVQPRENKWTQFFPIDGLFEMYHDGSLKLTGYNEKICLTEYTLDNSYDEVQFRANLKKNYTEYCPSGKNYVVCDMFRYVVGNTPNWLNVSRESGRAKIYSKYQAIKIAKRSSGYEPEKLSNFPTAIKESILNNPKNK